MMAERLWVGVVVMMWVGAACQPSGETDGPTDVLVRALAAMGTDTDLDASGPTVI